MRIDQSIKYVKQITSEEVEESEKENKKSFSSVSCGYCCGYFNSTLMLLLSSLQANICLLLPREDAEEDIMIVIRYDSIISIDHDQSYRILSYHILFYYIHRLNNKQ